MDSTRKRIPRRKDNRVVLHFDYDCFYAQVASNLQPALKSLPLGIKQKSILATCNYVARKRGVKKLMTISDAKKICPDLVLHNGEDLSDFRDVSKRLYALFRRYVWSKKVERMGLDECFLDVTDMVEFNVPLLNRNDLARSWFCLSKEDPEVGFEFDATAIAGEVLGAKVLDLDSALHVGLLLASHLARYLRVKIEEQGYTSVCGISTSKVLAKLAGSVNKPRNQTTLLASSDEDVLHFMDDHGLRQIPGIGGKLTHTLERYFLGQEAAQDTYTSGSTVKVGDFRTRPDTSPALLEKLLRGSGSPKGIGERIWSLLHGVDESEVKAASDVPTQLSIEDTYQGLNTEAEVERELLKLCASLLRRMHVDLVEDDPDTGRRWLAHPKTLRLTTRPKTRFIEDKPYDWSRHSHSQATPSFLFSLTVEPAGIVRRLVTEVLSPMFYKLNPDKGKLRIGLINIAVANMVLAAGTDASAGSGRDISIMFKKQDEVLKDFKVRDTALNDAGDGKSAPQHAGQVVSGAQEASWETDSSGEIDADVEDATQEELEPWDQDPASHVCKTCGQHVPDFAVAAHTRYHLAGE